MSAPRKLTFEGWLKKVDQVLARTVGLHHGGLADQTWWSWWDDGLSPAEAAELAIKNDMED